MIQEVPPIARYPDVGLPFHRAAIVDLALLPPQAGEQWRLASGDEDGWVRIWADGRLLAAAVAHPGGLTALELSREGIWYTAGVDGRVLEWMPGALTPNRAFSIGAPITALAVAGPNLAVGEGKRVMLWTRPGPNGEPPQPWWTMQTSGFVTGLALSASGGVVAAAELRDWALRKGIANHPLAQFEDGGAQTLSPEEQARLRAMAEQDFPGAVADFVEVWQPSANRSRQLTPSAPIDGDLGIVSRGGVIYREIYSSDNAGLIGRRLEDEAHYALEMIKPWAFWTDESNNPTPASAGNPNLPVGDFALGESEELLVVDLFPGWGSQPLKRGWRVGAGRELAIDRHHTALGDAQGNLAVVAWARPAETGWQAPTTERPDLFVAASGSPKLITATLEPRTQYRLWDLGAGQHRSIRVEAPWHVLPAPDANAAGGAEGADPAAGVPIYPFMLATDAQANMLVASASSFSGDHQAAVRALRIADGVPQVLTLATVAAQVVGLDIGMSPDGQYLLAWSPGSSTRSFVASKDNTGWTAGPEVIGGMPRFSANGRWSAHVSGLERTIVDLQAKKPVAEVAAEGMSEELGSGSLAAIGDAGTLAIVQPFGGGTLERIDITGKRTTVELPGAASALAWVPLPAKLAPEPPPPVDAPPPAQTPKKGKKGKQPAAEAPKPEPPAQPETPAPIEEVLLVGFLDGSVVRVEDDGTVTLIHAGIGGRIWDLAAVGGTRGVFVELDDRGLTLGRLVDDASLELDVVDANSLARFDGSPVEAAHAEGLVAVWRPGTAMPVCRVLDGTSAGLLAPAGVERWGSERAAELFAEFFSGASTDACILPEPEPFEPPPGEGEVPASEPAAPAEAASPEVVSPKAEGSDVQRPKVQKPAG